MRGVDSDLSEQGTAEMTQIVLSFRGNTPAAERTAAPPKDANARCCHRKAIATLLLALVMMVGRIPTPTYAQEVSSDLTALSLEELMDLDVLAINVLGTHTHLQGEWMLGYQHTPMTMAGNRERTARKSESEVLQDFPVAPTNMTMQMHMLEGMYAPTDNLTLMVMLPYLRLSMDHVTREGVRFMTKSKGIGDVQVVVLHTFYGNVRRGRHRFLFNAGLSFPTGSIGEKDNTPAGPDQKLPYPMQLGSGTFDLLPGITCLGQTEDWAWMVQPKGTVRLGRNNSDYRLGNRFHFEAWATRKWTDWLSPSIQMDGQLWGNVQGADPDLNPAMVPTADPGRRGGKRLDLTFAINLYVAQGNLRRNRFAIEAGFPIYQSLDGPQLETGWHWSLGWSRTF